MGTSGPKYQRIKDELRAELARDEYVAGAPFITQNQLRERFGVSSTTAVRALNDLVAEGLLVRRRGLGTFVADPSDRTAEPASAHRSGVVTCIISGQGPYQSEVLRGVESGCSERGLRLFFSDSAVRMTDTGHADHPASLARQDQALHQAVEDRGDGIILYPVRGAPDLDVLNETAGTSCGPSPGAGICPAPSTATSPWSTGRALYQPAGKRLPTSVAHALGLGGPPVTVSPHRVLLVGAGNIARTVHMPTFLELPSDFTVVGAVDADPTAARAFAAGLALPHHSTDLAEANHVTPARLEKLLALADGMSLPCVGFDELP